MLEVYRKAFPNTKPFLIKTKIAIDRGRPSQRDHDGGAQSGPGTRAGYPYRWDYRPLAYGGKFGAIHGTDVSLCLANTLPPILGDTPESATWRGGSDGVCPVQFGDIGNPNCKQILHWEATMRKKRADYTV